MNLEQGKSKCFFSFQHKELHIMEKKSCLGGKKKTFHYKELSQIKSTSDALLWHKGLSS